MSKITKFKVSNGTIRSIRNDDECHHKQMFYIPPITLQSMDTFTVGRELLSLSYVMGGIEKSCLRHRYSFLIALTARRNCKKSAIIFHNIGDMRSVAAFIIIFYIAITARRKRKKIIRIKS